MLTFAPEEAGGIRGETTVAEAALDLSLKGYFPLLQHSSPSRAGLGTQPGVCKTHVFTVPSCHADPRHHFVLVSFLLKLRMDSSSYPTPIASRGSNALSFLQAVRQPCLLRKTSLNNHYWYRSDCGPAPMAYRD